jgi:antitoxin (DNA-binding transcriptional repressor) of toxin-antitoxin stability system
MTDTVNLYDAKTNLSKLVDRAAAGEEIFVREPGIQEHWPRKSMA